MQTWYYKRDDQIVGPVTRQELDYLATERRIRPSTQVRQGEAGDWQRFRPIQNSENRVATNASQPEAAKTNEDETTTSDVVSSGPPRLEGRRDVTKRQAVIGAILAVLLLLLLWFLWSISIAGSPNGSTTANGSGLVQQPAINGNSTGAADEGDQPVASSADETGEASSVVSDGMDQSQEGEPLENSGEGSGEIESADDANQDNNDNQQSTASVAPANDNQKDDDLATETMDGRNSVQAGDPMSKFTISAPGEAVFFGLRATGSRFAFVVDRSGSMDGMPMRRAKQELMKCIRQMPSHVEVFVVFFDDLAYPDDGKYRSVDKNSLKELDDWVNTIRANGGTDVKLGVRTVFNEGKLPDAIFLLTDGNFDSDTPNYVRKLNSRSKVRINTVALVSRAGENLLKKIAADNDGDYRFVP